MKRTAGLLAMRGPADFFFAAAVLRGSGSATLFAILHAVPADPAHAYLFFSFRNLMYSLPQTSMLSSTGLNLVPMSVREYSTRGGTSG